MSTAVADVSVRVAWPADASAIARVQIAAWRASYGDLLPAEMLDQLPVEQFQAQWEQSITRPREARQRVLVALERATVRGFATTGPSTDADARPGEDAEIGELIVDPTARRAGHGSRLLHAAADTMRADGFSRATVWLLSTDDATRGFLGAQGWAPDGAYRELDLNGDGAVTAKQVRLHTDLTTTDV